MAYTFEMPEVGEGVVEVEVVAWKAALGTRVEVDQPLCEIATDKATLEISSPVAGVLTERFCDEGAFIKVHTPLCILDDAASASARPAPAAAPPAPAPPAAAPPAAAPPAPVAASAPPAASSTPRAASGPASDPASRELTKATPAVRRRARELGIDVGAVPGTGPGGRVSHDDLHAFQARPSAQARPPAPAASREDRRVPIRGVRRRIAERLQEAKRVAPHFTYVEEFDATDLVALREQLKPVAAARGIRLTFLPFFAKACSRAFADFPEVNSTMDEAAQELVVHGSHHMGFACDTPNGLVVPVVRDVDTKSLFAIAIEMDDLFTRARQGRCSREELSGSSFTITGVGSIGGVLATPILNRPEVAIVGTNAIRKRPVVLDDDRIVVRSMSYLSNSFDHRVIDGAHGARFTARLKALLEAPAQLLLEDA